MREMAERTYIVGAKRTAIGAFLGALKDVHPAEMGSRVVSTLLEDARLAPDTVDELICGNILSAGLGQGIARQIAMRSGIPKEVCAYSLNMLCGSGMKAVMNAVTEIRCGGMQVMLAGGVESMSGAPMLLPREVRTGVKMGAIAVSDHLLADALTDAFDQAHMGETAENIAEKYGISRAEQDAFAYASQLKAIAAVDAGRFADEIVPIEVRSGKTRFVFDKDEHPNRSTDMEKLAKLRPAFRQGGTVSAGNASGINDGASFVLLCGEEAVRLHGLTPMAEIIGMGQEGVEPSLMGMGPVPAIRRALREAGLGLADIDLIELNEAFAAQSLAVLSELAQEHGVDIERLKERTNVNGGAIALGHPVGASGNRILVSLVHEIKKRGGQYGLASLCIGGGMGTAVVIKCN